jgi:hypothetical protein
MPNNIIPNNNEMFKCIPGIFTPIRKNEIGDVECMSQDAKNCMWQTNDSECAKLISNLPDRIAPLSCGNRHKEIYGSTGYENASHWCSIGKLKLV